MAKAPKPWKLTEEESFASFTNWQGNITFVLQQEATFLPYLQPDVKWEKSDVENRGLQSDAEGVTDALSAAQKAAHLNQMLGLIAQWVPHFLTNDIVKRSTSLADVWNSIRKYYGFQQSETNFMKFSELSWEEGERPERLYQRVLAHLQDNLLTSGCRLKHDGVAVTSDEVISPTVERLAVLRWMELIHPSLPSLVARTFAYDLQRMTLKDLQPQIVDALDGFLSELKTQDVKVSRVDSRAFKPSYGSGFRTPQQSQSRSGYRPQSRSQPGGYRPPHKPTAGSYRPQAKQICRLCLAEGRPYSHRIVDCDHITRAERRSMLGRSCEVAEEDDVGDIEADMGDLAMQDAPDDE